VRPWVAVGDYGQARVDLYKAIVERFRVSNITIPFPQREVRMIAN
jgi:small conductance mechanosensitive channel